MAGFLISQHGGRLNVSGYTVYAARDAEARIHNRLGAAECDCHIVGGSNPYGIVEQSRGTEALNCARGEVDHKSHRNWLRLFVHRRRVCRSFTCQLERRWLLRFRRWAGEDSGSHD